MTAALLQAGGQSSRMRHGGGPEHKALVTVHGRTMLQWNLDALLSAGVTAIFLAVNKGETGLLRYIRELAIPYVRRNGATVVELVEDEPLGTIGSARRCACEDALLVVNVDNLSVLPLDMLAAFHASQGAAMTIATHVERFVMPFGELVIEGDDIVRLIEKPHQDYRISSGTYVLSPAAVALISPGENLGAPQLFDRVRDARLPVRAFRHDHPWIDVNDRGDVLRAEALVSAHRAAFERMLVE